MSRTLERAQWPHLWGAGWKRWHQVPNVYVSNMNWGAYWLIFNSPINLSFGRGMAGSKCCVKALELLQSRIRSRKQPNPITTSGMQHTAVSENHYCVALLMCLGLYRHWLFKCLGLHNTDVYFSLIIVQPCQADRAHLSCEVIRKPHSLYLITS